MVPTRTALWVRQMGVERSGSDSDSPGLPPTALHTGCRSMGYCCLLERCQQWLGLNTLPGVGMPQQDEQCAWLQQGTATHSGWHPHYYSSPYGHNENGPRVSNLLQYCAPIITLSWLPFKLESPCSETGVWRHRGSRGTAGTGKNKGTWALTHSYKGHAFSILQVSSS